MWGYFRRLLPGHTKQQAQASSELNYLPAVGRIQGASHGGDRTPKGTTVKVQYTDPQGRWHEMAMPFLDAMYLLNMLRAIQQDIGFVMPEDPYAPPPRV